VSDKPLNDDFNELDAETAEANAEHGLDAHPSVDGGDDLAPLDAVIAERDEWKDRALRVAAEMENLKRRAETQQNDARAFAIQRFAKDLLGVADNLERALMAAPKDSEGAAAGLVTGLELTQKSLLQAFDTNGLKLVKSDTVPGGAVLQTMQSGFELFGRTIRPAMVVVAAKGSGPKAANPYDAAPAADGHAFDSKA
jgi:molecular chaperone GrpE